MLGEHDVGPVLADSNKPRFCFVPLAVFDHDYKGVHVLAQIWDHAEPAAKRRWRYVLVLYAPGRGRDWEATVVRWFVECGHGDGVPLVAAAKLVEAWRYRHRPTA